MIGRHIFLQCNEWDAADVLERHLDFMLSVLDRHEDVYVRVSRQPAEAVVSLRVGGAHPLSRCASRAQPGRRAPTDRLPPDGGKLRLIRVQTVGRQSL